MSIRKGIILPSRPRALALFAAALITCAVVAFASPALAATFDPLNIIPYDTWRASASMSTSDIQAFLDAQPGPLGSLVTTDYAGVKKPASQIIWEAAHAQDLNPKVILATLQKEQSLFTYYVGMPVITKRSDGTTYTYHRTQSDIDALLVKAMGYGMTGARDASGNVINPYPGFGRQVWSAAFSLSNGSAISHWYPGQVNFATSLATGYYPLTVYAKNASTFALYTYTPYYPQKLVWDIYVRYFGDPQTPARMRPVYRFKSKTTGSLYYTMSEGTRYTMISKQSHDWSYDGTVFTVDASSTTNTAPLYRVLNTKTHGYFYTTSAAKRDVLLAIRPLTWHNSGTVGLVSKTGTVGARPVYQLENKRTHAFLLTTSLSTKATLTSGSHATNWYRGVFFSLGSSPAIPTPVGP